MQAELRQQYPAKETNLTVDYGVDFWLLFVVISLLAFSIVMVFSATVTTDLDTLHTNYAGLLKHTIHIALGLMLMFIMSRLRLSWVQSASKVLLCCALVMLLLVLLPGIGLKINGSVRWINILGFKFQPSELTKLVVIIYMADYLARKKEDLHLFKVGILNIGLVLVAIVVLILLQPDFGASVIILATVGLMLFLGGVRFWHFTGALVLAVGVMALIMWVEPYRVARLLIFRDPWVDPFGSGFQLIQALIAIGRGEWFGTGLGSSIQKLFYLPHAGNDFVISIVGEELGTLGIFSVLALYGILLFRAFAIARKAFFQGDSFAGFLCQGVGILVSFQAIIHVGVNTGLLPTKGLTLPLISYGGSSMVCTLAAIGFLFAVDRKNRSTRKGSI